jgi:predicted XRE-type DNA-binding protein
MTDFETGTGNVYDDLEMDNAQEMQVKASLAIKIGDIIKHRHLTQQQAAELLDMPQPKVSAMLRGQFRGISEAKMIACLNALGRNVQIVVKKAPRSKPTGFTSVVFA